MALISDITVPGRVRHATRGLCNRESNDKDMLYCTGATVK